MSLPLISLVRCSSHVTLALLPSTAASSLAQLYSVFLRMLSPASHPPLHTVPQSESFPFKTWLQVSTSFLSPLYGILLHLLILH